VYEATNSFTPTSGGMAGFLMTSFASRLRGLHEFLDFKQTGFIIHFERRCSDVLIRGEEMFLLCCNSCKTFFAPSKMKYLIYNKSFVEVM